MRGDFPLHLSWWDPVRQKFKGGGDGGSEKPSVNQLRGLSGWDSAEWYMLITPPLVAAQPTNGGKTEGGSKGRPSSVERRKKKNTEKW